jgi:hypothetical protein
MWQQTQINYLSEKIAEAKFILINEEHLEHTLIQIRERVYEWVTE